MSDDSSTLTTRQGHPVRDHQSLPSWGARSARAWRRRTRTGRHRWSSAPGSLVRDAGPATREILAPVGQGEGQ